MSDRRSNSWEIWFCKQQ